MDFTYTRHAALVPAAENCSLRGTGGNSYDVSVTRSTSERSDKRLIKHCIEEYCVNICKVQFYELAK